MSKEESGFSEYLLRLLEKKRVDQHELAQRIGRSYAYINQLANGSRPAPKPRVSEQISKALQCNSEERKTLIGFSIQRFVGKECSSLVENVIKERAPLLNSKESTEARESPILWALIQRLPRPNTLWPETERTSWLKAAEAIFGLEYKIG